MGDLFAATTSLGVATEAQHPLGESKDGGLRVQVIRGAAAVLKMQEELSAFSERLGCPGALSDLVYFVGKPGALQVIASKIRSSARWPGFLREALARFVNYALRREPVLLLASATSSGVRSASLEVVKGALLLYEYHFLWFRSGLLTTNDRTGRRCFVAEGSSKSAVLRACLQQISDDGGQVMLHSLDPEMGRFGESLTSEVRHLRIAGFRYAGRERSRKAFLPLLATTDSTFAQVRRRTRKNIQQCRQKTHEEIGCSFDENVQISRTSLLKMNRSSVYAVSDQIAEWRYDRLSDVISAFVAGMKDREGRWLSLIGCRRLEGNVEILWQINLNGYPHLSLSLVARSFLIEGEFSEERRR